MKKSEILQKLIDYYCDGNKARFARMIGLTPQAVSSWIRRESFDADILCSKCARLNANWLHTGEGPMIDIPQPQTPPSAPRPASGIEKILASMQQEVAENNKFMRDQMKTMQDMLSEAMKLMRKSQEYYERALELHERRDSDSPHRRIPHTNYLAEPFKDEL